MPTCIFIHWPLSSENFSASFCEDTPLSCGGLLWMKHLSEERYCSNRWLRCLTVIYWIDLRVLREQTTLFGCSLHVLCLCVVRQKGSGISNVVNQANLSIFTQVDRLSEGHQGLVTVPQKLCRQNRGGDMGLGAVRDRAGQGSPKGTVVKWQPGRQHSWCLQ